MSTFFLSLSASVPFVSFNQFLETRNRYRVKGRGGNTWNPGIPSTSSYGMPGIRDGDGRTFIRHDQRPGPPVVLCAQSRKFSAHISTRREGVKRDSEGSHENFTDRFHTGARVLRSTVLRRESLWSIDFTILIASFPDHHDDNSPLYGETRPNIVSS